MYYVYLLKWNKYYVWSTNNIKRRLQEHARWTTHTINKQIGEYRLIWYFQFETEIEARNYEQYIKKSGHYNRLPHRDNFIKS